MAKKDEPFVLSLATSCTAFESTGWSQSSLIEVEESAVAVSPVGGARAYAIFVTPDVETPLVLKAITLYVCAL